MSFVAVGVGTAAVGLAGSVFGAIKSGEAAKANQKIIDGQLAEARTDANRSFLDTATAKDAMKQANEGLVDARKNVAGRAAITGASDEASVASNTAVGKNYNGVVSRLAGMGTQYQRQNKDRVNALLGGQMAINSGQGESASAVGANAMALGSTIAMSSGMKGTKTDSTKTPTIAKQGSVANKTMTPATNGFEPEESYLNKD